MIKTFIAASVVVSFLVTPTFAEEQGKVDLSIESMIDRPLDKPEDEKIKVSELKKGVFVTAVGGWSGVYPKTAQMVKDRLIAKGVKVVELPSDADVGLQFVGNPFDLEEVETNISAGIYNVKNGINAFSALTNPTVYIAAALLTPSNGDKIKTMISARLSDSPTVSGRGKMSGNGKRDVFLRSDIIYYTKHHDAAVSTLVFTAYIDKFIDNHFVFDANSAVPTPPADSASAVPPVATNEAVPVAH